MKNELLDTLAVKLETTSVYLWDILIDQAYVSAMIDSAVLVLLLAIFALSLFYRAKVSDSWDIDGYNIICVFTFSFALFYFIFSAEYIYAGFFNPEYWALLQLIGNR